MAVVRIVIVVLVGLSVLGCTSAERRAARAQQTAAEAEAKSYALEAAYKQQRLDTLEEYKACVLASDEDSVEACDRHLKILEAMQ